MNIYTIEEKLGFHRYNITSLMEEFRDESVITIRVWGRNNALYDSNYIMFYSKDSDVSNEYKPQLIWS